MPRDIPPPLSLALTSLRSAKGWTQADLAEAAGFRRQTICDLETGSRKKGSRETLEALAAAMGFEPEDVGLALLFHGGLATRAEVQQESPLDPTPSEIRRARRIAARVGLTETSRTYDQLLDLA